MAIGYVQKGVSDLSASGAIKDEPLGGSNVTVAAGDTIYFPWDVHLTAGLSTLQVGTNGLADCYILGNVTATGPLVIDCHLTASSAIYCHNSSALQITAGSVGVENIVIGSPGANITLSAGQFDDVQASTGRWTALAGCDVVGVTAEGGLGYLYYDSTAVTSFRVLGGARVSSERPVTTGIVAAPTGGAALLDEAAVGTSMSVYGGTYNHRSSGTVAALHHFGGVTSPYGAPVGATITSLTRYGSGFVTQAGPIAFTITAETILTQAPKLTLSTLNFSAPLPQ